jgi:signal transduction histidine kinase
MTPTSPTSIAMQASRFAMASRQQWQLALMLFSLHGLLVWGIGSELQTAWALFHYGCFLLWQPVLHGREPLTLRTALILLAGGVAMTMFMGWWLMAFWLCLLFSLLGGRIFSLAKTSARPGFLLAATYLLAMLTMHVVPRLLARNIDTDALMVLVEYGLLLLPVGVLFTKAEHGDARQALAMDFFYTLMLLMITITLVLGCFAIATTTQARYTEVLLKMIFALAAGLLALSWFWNPRAGFSGIGLILSRYLLSVGLPFEQWIQSIAELAQQQRTPASFLSHAIADIAQLPWVEGATWRLGQTEQQLGKPSMHLHELQFHDVNLTLYSRWPLTPALTIHVKLLTRIVAEFYEAKRREEIMTQNAYMQAVYETGARLTHDIKNLVQSMGALCSAAEHTAASDQERLLALIRKQLPLLNERMAKTLTKLQSPASETRNTLPILQWWESFQAHYPQLGIIFETTISANPEVDGDVLDSVTDNLIQNALVKRSSQPGLAIYVSLSGDHHYTVAVRDTGSAMPATIAENLFKKQVSSGKGLGIGLYQAAKQANASGLTLALKENREGAVWFTLGPQQTA